MPPVVRRHQRGRDGDDPPQPRGLLRRCRDVGESVAVHFPNRSLLGRRSGEDGGRGSGEEFLEFGGGCLDVASDQFEFARGRQRGHGALVLRDIADDCSHRVAASERRLDALLARLATGAKHGDEKSHRVLREKRRGKEKAVFFFGASFFVLWSSDGGRFFCFSEIHSLVLSLARALF